jgi:hypothetical protein
MKIANDWSIACNKSARNVGKNVGTAKTHCAAATRVCPPSATSLTSVLAEGTGLLTGFSLTLHRVA